jgi:flagellar motor switch protein FliN
VADDLDTELTPPESAPGADEFGDGPDAGQYDASAAPGPPLPAPDGGHRELAALELMLDVPLDVTVELGRASMQLGEALALQPGSVIELNRLPGEPLDMHINDRLVARGEVVVVNESLGLRVTEIVGREPRRPRSSVVMGG